MTPLNQRRASACDKEHFCYCFECDNCNNLIANFSLMCCQCSKSQEFCMETGFGSEYGVRFNIPYLYKLKVLDFRKRVHLTLQSPLVTMYTIRPIIQQFQISDQTTTISLYSINCLVL